MKKIFIGVLSLTLITSTAVFAVNSTKEDKANVTCSSACPSTSGCVAGTTCTVIPNCVCK